MKTYINGISYSGNMIFNRGKGNYHRSSPISGNRSVALVADTLYAVPFFNKFAITTSSIGVHVSSISAGSSIRLGIYNDNGSIYPGTLLLDAGTVSGASNGVKTITISQSLGEDTLYWLALVTDGIPSLNTQENESMWSIIGYDNTTFNTDCPGAYGYAFAYAALPDPYAAGATTYLNQWGIVLEL